MSNKVSISGPEPPTSPTDSVADSSNAIFRYFDLRQILRGLSTFNDIINNTDIMNQLLHSIWLYNTY